MTEQHKLDQKTNQYIKQFMSHTTGKCPPLRLETSNYEQVKSVIKKQPVFMDNRLVRNSIGDVQAEMQKCSTKFNNQVHRKINVPFDLATFDDKESLATFKVFGDINQTLNSYRSIHSR